MRLRRVYGMDDLALLWYEEHGLTLPTTPTGPERMPGHRHALRCPRCPRCRGGLAVDRDSDRTYPVWLCLACGRRFAAERDVAGEFRPPLVRDDQTKRRGPRVRGIVL